jgi:predicted nucleic acid-binding protein
LTLIVDSYAWVEFLAAGPRGPLARNHIESPGELVTPDIVLAEVARVLARQGMDSDRIAGHLRSIGALSTVLSVTVEIALETIHAAGDLRHRARSRGLDQPSFSDAIILAFARCMHGSVLTADKHFEGLPEATWIGN